MDRLLPAPASGSRREVVLAAVVLAAAALHLAFFCRFELVDDAFISLRYARNLLAGHGLVFNPGERVEGYTNFLWVISVAQLGRLGAALPQAARLLGFACALAVVWLTHDLLPEHRPMPVWRRWLAPALLALSPPFALWSVHGLETPLFTLLVVLAVRADVRERSLRAGAWYGLATLARPEGMVLFAASAVQRACFEGRGYLRRAWRWALPFCAVVLPHLAWRLAYYGQPLPNTFYAKVGGTSEQVRHGVEYLARFFLAWPGPLFLLCLPALWYGRRVPGRRHVALLIAAALLATVVEGGDFFPAFRFVVPLLPLLYALVQEGLGELLDAAGARGKAAAGVAAVAGLLWGAHVAGAYGAAMTEVREGSSFATDMKEVGVALKATFPPGTTVAANPVGALAYYSELPIIDLLGLTDAHIAHTPLLPGPHIPGHERGDGRYVFSRKPDLVLVGNVLIRSEAPDVYLERSWPAWLRSEGEFVRQPGLKEWYRRDWLRLPDGRYLYFLRKRPDLGSPDTPRRDE